MLQIRPMSITHRARSIVPIHAHNLPIGRYRSSIDVKALCEKPVAQRTVVLWHAFIEAQWTNPYLL